ncbi:thioesterase [Alkalicoccus urumqiensis]|uniref:Thioesterase n=1 Tax=Alkalicoccus urumqiensis TaxID=1548213 RepID=A0A2P6ME34_ALKUR|nr:thioesterase [Alkalicoccus urumqiensis]
MNQVTLQDVITGTAAPPPCDVSLGMTLQHAGDGLAHMTWQPGGAMINGNGVVMGGFTSAAADVAVAYAVASVIHRSDRFGSIQLDTVFHRPVSAEEVQVHASVKRTGRTIAYVTADLFQQDKLCASASSTVSLQRG